MSPGLVGGELLGVDPFLDPRIVVRELGQFPVAEPIGPGVTHVAQNERPGLGIHGESGEGGTHPDEFWIVLPLCSDRFVRRDHRAQHYLAETSGRVFVRADSVRKLFPKDLSRRLCSHPARDVASWMSTHPIGHYCDSEVGKQGQAVLVPGPGLPDIGQSDHSRMMGHG